MSEGSQPAGKDGQVQRWQAPKPPARKSGQKGVIMVAGAVFVTLAAAGGASVALFDVTRVHLGYDAAKAAYLKEGLPWSADDISAQTPVPDNENAGPELTAISLEYSKLKGKPSSDFAVREEIAQAHAFLAPRNALLDRTAALLKDKKGLDFKRDWSKGAALDFGELAQMRALVKDLSFRAEVKALEGDSQGALRDLSTAADLSVRASTDQVLISALVSSACRSIVCRSARLIAGNRQDDPFLLRSLEKAIQPMEARIGSEGFIRSEAYTHLWTLRNLKRIGGLGGSYFTGSGEPPPHDPRPFADKVDVTGIAERSMAVKSFEFWTDVAREAKKRPNDPISLFDYLDRKALEADRSSSSSMVHLKLLLPVFGQAGPALLKHEAVVKSTRAALLAWAARAEGRPASSLKQVKGGPWTDPFSDEEFKAQFEKDKVLIWSVGRNRRDQGGAPDTTRHLGDPKWSNEGDDVAVQIPDLATVKGK